MAEFVTCPACGCSVQVADTLLGRRVRCFGCHQPFVATAHRPTEPASGSVGPAIGSVGPASRRSSLPEDEYATGERGPLCPGCGRRITWRDLCCPFCGEELEPEDNAQRERRREAELARRDAAPHRGPLIVSLGNLSAIAGGLSLCSFGLGACFSIPVGILTWMMATRDLESMRDGRMDPRGKAQTEIGRTSGIAGIILGLIFAAFYAFIYLMT